MYDGIFTSDSSFISIGVCYVDGTAETGADLVVIKLDENGDSLWTKRYGGQYHDYSETVIETFNGNYLIAGYTTQDYSQGDTDAWLLLLDSNGDSLWSNTYAETIGQGIDKAYSVVQAGDGSFVFCGIYDYSPFVAKTEYAESISELPPVLADIDNQQIEEDGSVTLEINATSYTGLDMTFAATSDTSDVVIFLDNTTLTVTPETDWYGTANVTVMVTDEDGLSDTTEFTLTVTPVNDAPQDFDLVFPVITDTIQINTDTDETIQFYWEESIDIDSDVSYLTTITLNYFGNVYTLEYESDTSTVSIPGYDWAELMTAQNIDIRTFQYSVKASDEEFEILSEGEFVFQNTSLSIDENISPLVFSLQQNYPNPFNPITTLKYDLPEDSFVSIIVYDMLGNVVNKLVNKNQNSGYKSIQWNATNNSGQPVSAGVYLYTIEAGDFRQTKKMVLLK